MIALSTGSLYTYDVAHVFELAKEAGFEGIEALCDQRWDTRQADYLKRLRDRHGLPVVSVHSPFFANVPGWPASEIERCKQAVALAEAVGARTVIMHLPTRFAWVQIMWPERRSRTLFLRYPSNRDKAYLNWLGDGLAEFQATTKVTIAIENLPLRKVWFGLWKSAFHRNTPDDWEQLQHWTMDTTHLGTYGLDVLAIYERLKSRLAHIHLSNFNGKEHRLLTDGHLPLADLLQRLRRDRYQGVLTCELDPDPLGASDENVVRANLRGTYEFCKEHYGATD